MRTKLAVLVALALLLAPILSTGGARAASPCTVTVPAGGDIQGAIDAAAAGSVICLSPGLYTPMVTIMVNKSVTLTAEDPYAVSKPVITGGGVLGTIIYVAANDVTLDGLEIAHGTGDLVKSETPAVARVVVKNSVVHGSTGDDGVELKYCTDCLIECSVSYNMRQDGFAMAYATRGTIRDNEVYDSRSENGAIYVYDSYDMAIVGNHIHNTQAANGIFLYKNYGSSHVIRNNLIVHNEWLGDKHCYDQADGNAINIYKPRVNSTYTVQHNTIDGNMPANLCAQPGNAIYVNDGDNRDYTTNVLDNLVTDHAGYGIRTYFGAIVSYSYNDLWSNTLGATDGAPTDAGNNIAADPLYAADHTLLPGSPAYHAASDGKDMGVIFSECGCAPPDNQGPVTSNVLAAPNPVAVSQSIALTANVDDTTTGGSNIASAEYKVDGGSWTAMSAADGAFDEVSEDVAAALSQAQAGVYTVCVRGTDARGNVGAEQCIMLVVYDPSGGFVTGGGWINSPAGAYTPDPSLTGKANFGFVSKYQKGAAVPTGQTEFQFKVAGLNFHSTSYDWLVVNQGGTNAQFKGTGTINGTGVYRFMIWAGDGEPDTFRIKIWLDSGGVVYDNGVDQAIGGGSIVIHKK